MSHNQANKSIFKKIMMVFVIFAVILMSAIGFVWFSIDSEWMTRKLEDIVKNKMNADLSIGNLELNKSEGQVTLTSVSFSQKKDDSHFKLEFASAATNIKLLPLILNKQIHIESFYLENPDIEYSEHKKEKTMTKKKKSKKEPLNIFIEEFEIKNGNLNYILTRDDKKPFTVKISNLMYKNQNIDISHKASIYQGSDIYADIDLGPKASLVKSGSSNPRTFDLKNIEMQYADKLLKQEDAIEITDGQLSLSYVHEINSVKGSYEMSLANFKLKQNKDSNSDRFMFLPAGKVVDYINERSGNLELGFSLDEGISPTQDFAEMTSVIWKAMWETIIKDLTSTGIGEALNIKDEEIEKKIDKGKKLLEDTFDKFIKKKDK